MAIDPFSLKPLPRRHPKRAAYMLWFRYKDWPSRRRYNWYAIPPPTWRTQYPTSLHRALTQP